MSVTTITDAYFLGAREILSYVFRTFKQADGSVVLSAEQQEEARGHVAALQAAEEGR